jgi:hypothetical protein
MIFLSTMAPSLVWSQERRNEGVECVPISVIRTCAEQDEAWNRMVEAAAEDAERATQAYRERELAMQALLEANLHAQREAKRAEEAEKSMTRAMIAAGLIGMLVGIGSSKLFQD